MRFLRRQSTNRRSIIGKGVSYTAKDEVVIDTSKAMVVPKGSTAQRPLTPENGHLRYNTDTAEFEFYSNSQWRKVSYKEPTTIHQQNLGNGDDVETLFGPLNSNDPDFPIPASAESIIVLIENVFQLATTNYTLVQNPAGKDPGWYLNFGTAVPSGKPVTAIHNFDK